MADEIHDRGNSCPSRVSRHLDRQIAALADRQDRVVERTQLIRLGVSADEIKYRVEIGRLHRVLPRVYAVGGKRLTRQGRLMAATLWAGPGAVLSHRSAAALWSILPPRGGIHVTCCHRRTPRPGITVHQRRLPADEITTHDGVPVTTVARALLDVAASEGQDTLVRALRQADYLRLTDATPLATLVARYPRGRGNAVAAGALADERPPGHTESELEDRFFEFLDERGLRRPRLNAEVQADGRWFRVDCLWERERLVVELDGRRAHMAPDRFESDSERDLILGAAGFAVYRVTWKRLHRDGDRLERNLRAVLGRRLTGVG